MRVVATGAGKRLACPFRVSGRGNDFPFFRRPWLTERVSGLAEPGDGMGTLPDLIVTIAAELHMRLHQHAGSRRGVGIVAAQAHPSGHRRMDVLPGKFRFVMAGKALLGDFGGQELWFGGCMRVMAGGAAHLGSRMHLGFCELFLVMAPEADLGLVRRQPLGELRRLLVRDLQGIANSGVTGRAAHLNGRVHHRLVLEQAGMALEAIHFLRCCRKRQKKDGREKDKSGYQVRGGTEKSAHA